MARTADAIQDDLEKIIRRMSIRASGIAIKGTAVAAYLDQDKVLVSRAMACGRIFTDDCNLLAIAYSKIAEMCSTLKNSGCNARPPLHGEHGYAGGALLRVGECHYLASFSGAKGEEDVDVALCGLQMV